MSAPRHTFTFDPHGLSSDEFIIAIDLTDRNVLDSGILIIDHMECEPGGHLGFQGTVYLDEVAGELRQPMKELRVEGLMNLAEAHGYYCRRP